jgi:hypothetical protein
MLADGGGDQGLLDVGELLDLVGQGGDTRGPFLDWHWIVPHDLTHQYGDHRVAVQQPSTIASIRPVDSFGD